MVKVSIGLIARDEEKHIGDLIKSLVNLNFPKDEYEIILVDGDSLDKTIEKAEEIFQKSNIKYKIIEEGKEAIKKIMQEKDVNEKKAEEFRFKLNYYGPCFARNLVIKNADKDGRYIAFIDADCIADKDWLKILYKKIEGSGDNVVGVGGARLMAETDDKIELLINAILTSFIASGGNPAFSKRNVKYVDSIPNYNAIYKKEILERFRYDTSLVLSDDCELNYRLRKNNYKFLYERNAIVWHHETSSIKEFLKNMFRYGVNISRVVKKHREIVRIYVPLTVLFVMGPILSLIWILGVSLIFKGTLFYNLIYLPFLFYGAYFLFVLAVFIEVLIKTKDILRSLLVFVLVPLQHFCYGLGVLKGLFFDSYIRK